MCAISVWEEQRAEREKIKQQEGVAWIDRRIREALEMFSDQQLIEGIHIIEYFWGLDGMTKESMMSMVKSAREHFGIPSR